MQFGYLDLPDLIREKIWSKLGFQSRTNLRLTCTELYNEYNDEDIWKGSGKHPDGVPFRGPNPVTIRPYPFPDS